MSLQLRSALKKRRSFHDSPLIVDDNFLDLQPYPNYYSLMVVNFVSSLTQNTEKIFYKYIQERKRRDIIVITMKDVETYLQVMRDDPRYIHLMPVVQYNEEEEEVDEEEEKIENSIDAEIPIDIMIMVIKDKIEAAVQENERVTAQREALAKFRILDYWRTGVGLSEESLSIMTDGKGVSKKKSEQKVEKQKHKTESKKSEKKEKSKKLKKSKSDTISVVAHPSDLNKMDEFKYVIPDYDFTNEIWSKLTQRGQERFDKVYIEDFPVLGPKIYIVLLNFHDIDLMVRLIEENVYLNSIIQIYPFGATDNNQTWKLIDMDKRRLDVFKPVSFFEHYITYSDKAIQCYIDRMNAYNLICHMLYDADDIRRQYVNFLCNCNLINVASNTHVIVKPSEIDFLFSNEIEFYMINLYDQIDEVDPYEDENYSEEYETKSVPTTTPPIKFKLFDDRIVVVENDYNFLKKNDTLYNFDELNGLYYNYISKMNQSYFAQIPKYLVTDFNFDQFKYIKYLTKYAFNETIFQLNATSSNVLNNYQCHYYEIDGSPYRIVHYTFDGEEDCEEKACYCKTVVPTQLCHRDFNEFLVDEIQPWLTKQEYFYNDLLNDYMYEKYMSDLPRHIEFHLKYVREQDFIYEPSIKMETYLTQQHEFESLKLKEYGYLSDYLEMRTSKQLSFSANEHTTNGKKSKKTPRKAATKTSIDTIDSVSMRTSTMKNRISGVQPFDEFDEVMLGIENPFLHHHHHEKIAEKKKVPIKAFNVYDLGDTRYQIDNTDRKFYFKNGSVRHYLEEVLYKEKYQAITLRFCLNRFFLNRIYLADHHPHYFTKYIRIITENETVINLNVNEIEIPEYHTGWTPSSTTSEIFTAGQVSEVLESETDNFYVSAVINWPNGLKIQINKDEETSESIIAQEWYEGEGRDNEKMRWYFPSGCCVVYCLNFVIKVYTPHGVFYEIGDANADEEEETVEVPQNFYDFEELQNIYEFELNYLTFLSKFVLFDKFNLTLPNGCKMFVQDGKIIKYLSQKPDKLLVKEHIDYILGEKIIRREDGFKMLFNANEQIVIYPDGTILQSEHFQQVENLEEIELSELSSTQSTPDLLAGGTSIVSYFLKQVIRFSTSDHYQFINRKSQYFFHENYSAVQWELDSNKISFDNYDQSINIVYNNGKSITGILTNNRTGEQTSDKVEDLTFDFDPDCMTIDQNGFNSKIYLHRKTEHDCILMSTSDHEYLNQMEITSNGEVNMIKNLSVKCPYIHEHPRIIQHPAITQFNTRTFLINEQNDDRCFELFKGDIKCNRKDDIIKDDDGHLLVMNNINAEINSTFKSSSPLFSRIPDRLATKPDNLCKQDDDTLEIYEKQIKSNFFKKISNRLGFAYYQKYSSNKPIKMYYCDNKRMEKLCINGINYFVDQQYQHLIDVRDEKRRRLLPSEAFRRKMREIEERNRLANTYRLMLRYNIVPNYFDFHEHDDHIKNMDVSKYSKSPSKIRYTLPTPSETES